MSFNALICKARRMEGAAELLRMEAQDVDTQAADLRAQARRIQCAVGLEEDCIALFERISGDAASFVSGIKQREGAHPLLGPLRRVLVKLDALLDQLRDRQARGRVQHVITPLQNYLHVREIAAWPERRAA